MNTQRIDRQRGSTALANQSRKGGAGSGHVAETCSLVSDESQLNFYAFEPNGRQCCIFILLFTSCRPVLRRHVAYFAIAIERL